MRSYRRRMNRRRGGSDGSFWLSFSDLMSSLVIIIILVMFYIIYQYFNLAEINEAEIASRESQLDQAQTELDEARAELESQQTELATAQADLETAQADLETAQTDLETAQAQLETQQTELETAQAQLETQQTDLETAQADLETAQTELETAQAQLATQQTELETAQAQLETQQTELEAAQALLDNQQTQIEQLVGVRPRIIASLSEALRSNNILATVDAATGSITLESDVLFDTGRYELSNEGRAFIDRFLPVYLQVLFSEEYRPYISEIIIEGHTDSDGEYLSNLALSQQRALAVASYVLGESEALSPDMKNQLRPVVTVNGRSYSDRIFDENGMENKDASRRVVFKFRLTDEQMIQQLQTILEDGGAAQP